MLYVLAWAPKPKGWRFTRVLSPSVINIDWHLLASFGVAVMSFTVAVNMADPIFCHQDLMVLAWLDSWKIFFANKNRILKKLYNLCLKLRYRVSLVFFFTRTTTTWRWEDKDNSLIMHDRNRVHHKRRFIMRKKLLFASSWAYMKDIY